MRPSLLKAALKQCIEVDQPVFIWGPPGVGKSEIVAQVASEMNYGLTDIRLNLYDPVDVKGFPVPNHDTKTMAWYPLGLLPPEKIKGKPNTTKGIVFLDEMTSAEPSMQKIGYQLVLDRCIGETKLPKGWLPIGAGNREGDRSNVFRMPSALANRFVHLDFDVSLDDWCAYAISKGVSSKLIGFLRFRSNLLHHFNGGVDRAFPTPRSWMAVNKMLQSSSIPANALDLYSGAVGQGAASELIAYLRVYEDLPTPDQIMMGPDSVPVSDKPSVNYALVTSLAEKASQNTFDRFMQYIKRLPVEFQVVFMSDAGKKDSQVVNTKSYIEWCVANDQIMV